MSCPLCSETMDGKLLCDRHALQVRDRAAAYNLSLDDALDQLWQIRADELAEEAAERFAEETEHKNGYPAGTIGAETR